MSLVNLQAANKALCSKCNNNQTASSSLITATSKQNSSNTGLGKVMKPTPSSMSFCFSNAGFYESINVCLLVLCESMLINGRM